MVGMKAAFLSALEPRASGPLMAALAATFRELRAFCARFLLPCADLEPELPLTPLPRPADGMRAAVMTAAAPTLPLCARGAPLALPRDLRP